jgi:mannobiose 2-epimerase
MDSLKKLKKIRKELKNELRNILTFWRKEARDKINGGFVGEMSNDLKILPSAGKGGVLNARILWTFSAAARFTGKKKDKDLASIAYHYFVDHFIDHEFGGTYWSVSPDGKPLETRKQIYAQAFSIYGLTEYAQLTDTHEPLELAMELFNLIEKHGFDKKNNGYLEAFNRQWQLHEDQRLSAIDMNEKKSMNTHLHIIEAYANLYSYTQNPIVKERVENLLEIFSTYIINSKTKHFNLFFDENWNVKSNKVSYGHDIEGSWLLLEAAEAIQSEIWIKKMKIHSVEMAQASLEGIDSDGGLKYEFVPGSRDEGEKEWWTIAEAVIGFYNAYQLSGNTIYFEKSIAMWEYLQKYFIDGKNGEWFYRIDRNHLPVPSYSKVSLWKCPYHNSRMCMEMIRRIDKSSFKTLNQVL